MEPFKFKEIVEALGVKFREILKTQTYAPYSVFDESERLTGQYGISWRKIEENMNYQTTS
jgi:hypothetical protein